MFKERRNLKPPKAEDTIGIHTALKAWKKITEWTVPWEIRAFQSAHVYWGTE